MAFALQHRPAIQCASCLRAHLRVIIDDVVVPATSLRQQIRGKKKMVNNSGITTVQLLKDVPAFGRRGAYVPVPTGMMRNNWFPQRIAEYLTPRELKRLRTENIEVARDFDFGTDRDGLVNDSDPAEQIAPQAIDATSTPSQPQTPTAPDRVTPQRSKELLEIFVPQRLEFMRNVRPDKPDVSRSGRTASSAGADLLAARTQAIEAREQKKPIFGSVSTHDVLLAVREAMDINEEAKTVNVNQDEVEFVGVPDEGSDKGKLRHIGDFAVRITIKGADAPLNRIVRVSPSPE